MLLKSIVDFSENMPELELQSNMLDALPKLYPDANKYKYAMASFAFGLFFGFLALLLLLILEIDILNGIFASLVVTLLAFLFFLALPSFELRRKTKVMEAEMPFVLRTIGMLRNMKINFMKCMEMAAEEDSEISGELKTIVNQVNSGITLEKALARFASFFSSYTIKRALSQILSAYELGSSGIEMRRIGDELLAVQQHELKESASKNAIFGMVFIMATAILPTFFLIYILLGNFGVGGGAVGGAFDKFTIAAVLLLVFPTISALLLLMSKATVPYSPLMPKGSVLDGGVLIGALLFVFSFLIEDEFFRYLIMAISIVIILWRIYTTYKIEKKLEEIEQYLPDALFSIATLPKSAKMEKIFDIIAQGGYKSLSEEALIAKRQLTTNINSDKVLEDLWRRNNSPALKKVCVMLKHAYDTNSIDQMHSIAEDILKNFEIRRDRAALMSMQKYTIMFGAVIIPFILKIALSLIGNLSDFLAANSSAVGETISYVISLIPPYLVIYSLISAFYIADIEAKKSRAAIYFLLLSFASIAIFNFFQF